MWAGHDPDQGRVDSKVAEGLDQLGREGLLVSCRGSGALLSLVEEFDGGNAERTPCGDSRASRFPHRRAPSRRFERQAGRIGGLKTLKLDLGRVGLWADRRGIAWWFHDYRLLRVGLLFPDSYRDFLALLLDLTKFGLDAPGLRRGRLAAMLAPQGGRLANGGEPVTENRTNPPDDPAQRPAGCHQEARHQGNGCDDQGAGWPQGRTKPPVERFAGGTPVRRVPGGVEEPVRAGTTRWEPGPQ